MLVRIMIDRCRIIGNVIFTDMQLQHFSVLEKFIKLVRYIFEGFYVYRVVLRIHFQNFLGLQDDLDYIFYNC